MESRSASPCGSNGWHALRSVRCAVATVALAIAGCSADSIDRNVVHTMLEPTLSVLATALAAEAISEETPAASASAEGAVFSIPTPVPSHLSPFAYGSLDGSGEEPYWSQEELKGGRTPPLAAAPSSTPTVENVSDGSTSKNNPSVSYLFSKPDLPIGYEGYLELKKPPSSEREDRLEIYNVTIRECVVRGTVYNASRRLFARNVVVDLEQTGGNGKESWHWPLTMLPGEKAPFEINLNWPPASSSLELSPWEHTSNIGGRYIDANLSVTGELSEVPDLGRAFTRNILQDRENSRYGSPQIIVHDERLYEYEEWDYWLRASPYYFDLQNRDRFFSQFPVDLIHSDDLDSIASEFVPLTYSNYSFTPEALFPKFYVPEEHHVVEDVRVYQAILGIETIPKGVREPWLSIYDATLQSFTTYDVLDVRELVPFKVQEGLDGDDRNRAEHIVPVTEVSNSEVYPVDPFYVMQLIPASPNKIFPYGSKLIPENVELRNSSGDDYFDVYPWLDIYYDSIGYQLWIGGASYNGPGQSPSEPSVTVGELVSSSEPRGQIRGSCDSTGGLYRAERKKDRQYWSLYAPPLGTYGSLDTYRYGNFVDEVAVDLETVTFKDDVVRGLAQNLSDRMFARDVEVWIASGMDCERDARWTWPLTVQPGERFPFQIESCTDTVIPDVVEFGVAASLSERLDISRSFHIIGHNSGSIYRNEAGITNYGNYNSYSSSRASSAHLVDNSIRWASYLHLLESEFWDIYPQGLEIDMPLESGVVEFQDLYAKLEAPVSHPSLQQQAITQTIETLKAYVAIFDSDMKVVDVKELVPFAPTYGSSTGLKQFATVDSIPAANVWAPNSVRLLFTYPREDEDVAEICSLGRTFNEDPCKYRDRYQVWIGGAVEPLP